MSHSSRLNQQSATPEMLAETLPRHRAISPPPMTTPIIISIAMLATAAIIVLALLWLRGNL